ncbi:ABC transporter permease subunit [Nonomuraea phyllanthi]|uniref:ABC transporter permease subunit n=1 Tax=Nonomuraea phyllanthi TaxID=2219224 RepID=A0A5C4VMU7_9ACTN|nr:iron ABC transporter permease [Nonomuraea phyllanthi]KAB8189643.1 ABC transporter permease subunit [Nonomuraea phyllanthi]QFY12005.1 ABC transporter permease subunit [Nonomuraea phyllanthi]
MIARLRALTPFQVAGTLLALALGALAVYPLALVVIRPFVTGGRIDLAPIRDTLAQPDLATLLWHTAVVVGGSGLAAMAIGSALAWVNERTDARMGLLTDVVPLVPFLLPPIAGAIGWSLLGSERSGYLNQLLRPLLGLGGTQGPIDVHSWYGLIFVYTIYQVPYVFMIVSAGLRNADAAMEEQSRVSGAGPFRTLRRVSLPAVRPSLGAAALLMVWTGFGLFSIPAILAPQAGIDILSVRVVRLLSFTYPPETGVAVSLNLVVMLVVTLVWYAQTRLLRSSRTAGLGGKGARARPLRLGRWRGPVRAAIVAYLALTSVLPLGGLVLVSLTGFWSGTVDWSRLNLDAVTRTLADTATQEALVNSLVLGAVCATAGMLAAAVVSVLVRRSGRGTGMLVDAAIKFPPTLSHLVVAVGFVLAFSGAPFQLGGTLWILMLAYVSLHMPQATTASDAAAGQVGPELTDASRVSGAGQARTFRRITLPLMAPGLLAGWALLFVTIAGDISASAILAGTGNEVVGFRILEVFANGDYAMLGAISILLTLATSLVVLPITWYARRRGASPLSRTHF